MFDVFVEVNFDNTPKKLIYKAVVHENLFLIQSVTLADKDKNLGLLDLD